MKEPLKIIGRAEKLSFPDLGVSDAIAKIDSGADLSSLWATQVREVDGVLIFKLFGPSSKHYTGNDISIEKPDFLLTRVASSFGHRELRYVVKLKVKIRDRTVRGTFTLSDRSKKTYPILVGRKLLAGKFLVDVTKGTPLRDQETAKKAKMKRELKVFAQWEKK